VLVCLKDLGWWQAVPGECRRPGIFPPPAYSRVLLSLLAPAFRCFRVYGQYRAG